MTASHLIAYALLCDGALTLYTSGDLALMVLAYLIEHLYDEPSGEPRARFKASLNCLCINLISAYVFSHWRDLVDHYTTRLEKLVIPAADSISVCRVLYCGNGLIYGNALIVMDALIGQEVGFAQV
jgi:hypothetical protein